MTIYNLKVDLVYDNVYTKIGRNKYILSQDIKKLISDVNQGPLLCCKFAKMTIYYPNVDLVNDNGYAKLVNFCPLMLTTCF